MPTPRHLFGACVLVLASQATLGKAVADDEGQAVAEIMVWKDLTDRPQPRPDATLQYGDDPLHVIDVWRPTGEREAPAVIMIHGGCWQTEVAERDLMNWIADDLRSHGVGVWNIEYRGVDREGGYPGTYEDVATAADLVRERGGEYGLKTDHVVVIGHSAGGHLALWLANRPSLPKDNSLRGTNPIRVDLAISQGGLPDLRAGALRKDHGCGADAPKKMSGPDLSVTSPPEMRPGEARQVLFNTSLDTIAPPAFAETYRRALKDRGVDVVIIETPGEGHVELIAPDSESWAKQRTLILKEFGLQ